MTRWLPVLLLAIVHLLVAWPGAGERGIIAEEVQPYLRHYPKVLEESAEVRFAAPYDDPALLVAIDAGRPVTPRWVGTTHWPELAFHGPDRIYPLLVRGHQTALGSAPGLAFGPWLGGGIAGVRRASVLLGLALVLLAYALARRLGASQRVATLVGLACALSPGLWFFARTGYGFELGSRVLMLTTLVVAAPLQRIGARRAIGIGLLFALAVLARATIAVTLAPPLLLLLFHPRRFPGFRGVAGILGLGGALPLLAFVVVKALLPLRAAPAADLALTSLSGRTLVALPTAWMQLAWVVDPRVVLSALVGGAASARPATLAALLGAVVTGVALVRWWRGTAREGERLFVAALLGNAILGAFLYGDPLQFQLGMALEPLFVLAVAVQLDGVSIRGRTPVFVAVAALFVARIATLASLAAEQRRTDNPMLSGRAQRAVVAALATVPGETVVTTAYDHVGVLESWTGEALRPIHAWKLLKVAGADDAVAVERWRAIFAARRVCHVLLGRAQSLVEGPFTDHARVSRALLAVATAQGKTLVRTPIVGDGGGVVFELVKVSPCE
ncbi:MAG: hypothetical protein IPJ34_18100 [Myxococcales bacterium]|nr:hypothetical protein [Myxococcales bacterium]